MAVLNKLKAWIPPLVWMGGTLYVSSVPGSALPDVDIPHIDKIAHFLEFFVFGVLVARAYLRSFPGTTLLRAIIISLCIATAYAIFDEWHQQFIPGRTVDFTDFFANFAGIVAGMIIFYLQ